MRLLSVGIVMAVCGCASEPAARPELGAPAAPATAARPVVLSPPDPLPPAPKEVVRIDPEAETTLRQNAAQPAVPLGEGAPPKVTGLALDHTALSEARGMTRDVVRTATLEEGRRAAMPLPLESADCLTVIAHGGLGVAEVDVFFVDPSGSELRIVAQDARSGPLGIVGGQRGCFVLLGERLPGAELWVQARKGAGPVVVGVFRAPKP